MITSQPNPPHRLPGAESGGLAGPIGASADPGAGGPSPIAMIDDRLRGRWTLAIVLGLLLGVGCAIGGFLVAPIKYQSSGTIRVSATGSAILRDSADTSAMPRYENMVRTQAVLVQDVRLIQNALDDEDVKALGISARPDAVEYVARNLSAAAVHQTELVSVVYECDSPVESVTMVNAILAAFERTHGGQRGQFRKDRLSLLNEQAKKLRNDRLLKKDEIQRHLIKSEYGAENLERVLEMKLLRIEELRQEKERLDDALRFLDAENADETPEDDRPAATEPTDAELAEIDPEFGAIVKALADQEITLRQLRSRYPERNLIVRNAVRDLEFLQAQIDERRPELRERWLVSAGGLAPITGDLNLSPAEIERQKSIIAARLAANQKSVRDLNQEQATLGDLQFDLEEIDRQLTEVDDAVRLLNIEEEAKLSGEVTVQSRGVRPISPSKDRRVPLAAVGFLGGFGSSIAFFFLLGSFDRRAFSANQLRQELTGIRCLGVLPDLGRREATTEMHETAAQCVHQIRNRIDALRRTTSSFSLVVSSPFQGDGKTSLSMALGWSYAAAGYRTLLVDADFYGQSLSQQLGARERPGLREVLRDRQLTDEITAVPVANLFVLGCGLDARFGPESIRRDDFHTLMGELRRDYDVIIVDTGPAIGSVELFPVASASDGVVFSVRRGRSRSSIESIMGDLDSMGVPALGVILNCANHADCERYVSKSTMSRRPEELDGERAAGGAESGQNQLVRAIERVSAGRES